MSKDFIPTKNKSTLEREHRILTTFRSFVKQSLNKDLSKILKRKDTFEYCLEHFFRNLRVGKDQTMPKKNTCEFYRSFIKNYVLKEAGWDISDVEQFPTFNAFYKDYITTLRVEGKAETEHHPPIPYDTLEGLFKLMCTLHELIVGNPQDEWYTLNIEQLSYSFRDKFHYLAQYGKLFLTSCSIFSNYEPLNNEFCQ